ncbi:MAG: hypothetical protein PF447_09835 [Spirochaetaceae bacterium]|nr:hypothetical protein [Spirochaetaceae bacterium]
MALSFAGGNSDSDELGTEYSIRDAKKLVEAKDYNQAMAILVEIVRRNPEQMEQAQQLIIEIRKNRDLYNEKYQELMDVLFVQEDYEKSLTIIQELESLDPNPNNATMDSIRDARISAELVYNRNVFNQIMDQALVFLNSQRYYQAIQLYETGFSLSKRTFDETQYDILIKNPVYRSMESLVTQLDSIDDNWEGYLSTTDEFISQGENTTPSEAMWLQLNGSMDDLFSLRRDIYEISSLLRRQNALVEQASPDNQEDFYLSFMERLITGRQGQDQLEGIITAVDLYLDQSYDRLAQYYEQQTSLGDERALTAYSRNQWSLSASIEDETLGLEEQWNSLLLKNDKRIHFQEDLSLDRLSLAQVDKYYPLYINNRLSHQERELLALEAQTRQGYNQQLTEYQNGQIDDFLAYRNQVRGPLDRLALEAQRLIKLENNLSDDPILNVSLQWDSSNSMKRYEGLSDEILNLDNQLVLDQASQDRTPLESLLQEYSNRLAINQSRIEGRNQQLEESTFLVRYPQQALNDLELLDTQMTQLRLDLQGYLDFYSNLQQEMYIPQSIEEDLQLVRDMLTTIGQSQDQMSDMTSLGERFVLQSRDNLNQGNFRYDQAESELSQNNFDVARNELTEAQKLFASALSFNEEISSREALNQRIEDLQARILEEENKSVIRDVRNFINQATSDYFQGLYLRSEASLVQAENRWSVTNTVQNDEVSYWLGLVRAALSVESGRILEETNPLFRDITQLLNLAYQNYDQGKVLIEQGDRVGGYRHLDQARSYLNQILIPLPINQDARVLNLRIEKLVDERQFNETFRERVREARSKIEAQRDVDTAYLDLKDLQPLNPDYPGLAAMILEAEYQLGIKVRPPDPAALRESQNLYRKARDIFNTENEDLYDEAIKDLDRAIALNPRNTSAITLKDKISLLNPGDRILVLPNSTAVSRFQEAEDKFINRQYLQASIIVEELWATSNYRYYEPLQILRERIAPFIQ